MSCFAWALLAQIPEIQLKEGDTMYESKEGSGANGAGTSMTMLSCRCLMVTC